MKITFTELQQILAERALLAALLVERESLKQQIIELLAGDTATAEKAKALFAKSEKVEEKMRSAIPAKT